MARAQGTVTYSSLDRRWRVLELVRVVTFGRRVEFAGWIHGVAVACSAGVWFFLPGWWRWPGAVLVAGAPWLASVVTAFGRDTRRQTLTSLGSVLAPKRSFRRHRERFEDRLRDLRFPVVGVEGPGPLTIVGYLGDSELDMLELAHGELEGTGPLVRVATQVLAAGDDPEHHRWSLEGQLRYLDRPPPSADGLSPEEWAEAVGEHKSAVEAGPSLRWEPATMVLDGQPVPAEVTRSGRCSAAMITLDRHLLTVLVRDVALTDLELVTVDPRSYDRPWD